MLAKADPLNAARCLLAALLVGYRSTRGVSLLEPDALRSAGYRSGRGPSLLEPGTLIPNSGPTPPRSPMAPEAKAPGKRNRSSRSNRFRRSKLARPCALPRRRNRERV